MPLSFNKKPALVAYVTCGDPNLATTREIVLAAIDAGADVIELGVPFSDPVADGPVIQRASQRAIQQGTTLRQVLHLAADVRERSQAGLIIFSYLNPVMRIGLSKFGTAARDAGVDGVLLIALPLQPVQTGGSMKSRGFRLGSCMPSLVPGLPASKSNSLRTRKPWFDA